MSHDAQPQAESLSRKRPSSNVPASISASAAADAPDPAPPKLLRHSRFPDRRPSLRETAPGDVAPVVEIPQALRYQVHHMSTPDPEVCKAVAAVLAAATKGTGRKPLTLSNLASLLHAYLAVCLGPSDGCVFVCGKRVPLACISAAVLRTLYRLADGTAFDVPSPASADMAPAAATAASDHTDITAASDHTDFTAASDHTDITAALDHTGMSTGDPSAPQHKALVQAQVQAQVHARVQAQMVEEALEVDAKEAAAAHGGGGGGGGLQHYGNSDEDADMCGVFGELRWCILPLVALLRNKVSAFGGALTLPEGDDDDHTDDHRHPNLPVALHWLQFVAAGNPHMMARLNAARASFTRKLAAAANAMCAYTAHFRPF